MIIKVSKMVKVGVGKFECVDVSASIETEVDERVKEVAFANLWNFVDAQLNKQVSELQDIVKPDSVFKQVKSSGEKQRRSR